MDVKINVLSVFNKMLVKLGQMWHIQEDCSKSWDQPWQMKGHCHWHDMMVRHQED